ncbi:MAG: hypothetical protein VSS52_011985 [Thiotrichaceae bacterium]|nr:hypothetical protein [Thiotrichaceae bacterium]
MLKKTGSILTACIAGFIATSSVSAEVISIPLNAENEDKWEFADAIYTFENYLGQDAIILEEGLVLVKGSDSFVNGTVEFDIIFDRAYDPAIEKAFGGVAFRAHSQTEFQVIRSRDNKFSTTYGLHYFPTYDGQDAIQLYYGPGHNPTVMDAPYDQWVHVKLVVADDQGEIFVEDMTTPALFINNIRGDRKAGKVGLYGNHGLPIKLAAVRLSNFQYEIADAPPVLVGTPEEVPYANDPNLVKSWLISSPFAAPDAVTPQLAEIAREGVEWGVLNSDYVGIANISKVAHWSPTTNAVFARININSDYEQVKKFSLGFSDTASVYLNGKLLIDMDDEFLKRDYSFLGTIGFFDDLYLPLRKGGNELWILVTEVTAGWGLKAKFDDLEGIKVDTSTAPAVSFDGSGNECAATYSPVTGKLNIPCIELANDPNLYEGSLTQDGFGFTVDDDSIRPR